MKKILSIFLHFCLVTFGLLASSHAYAQSCAVHDGLANYQRWDGGAALAWHDAIPISGSDGNPLTTTDRDWLSITDSYGLPTSSRTLLQSGTAAGNNAVYGTDGGTVDVVRAQGWFFLPTLVGQQVDIRMVEGGAAVGAGGWAVSTDNNPANWIDPVDSAGNKLLDMGNTSGFVNTARNFTKPPIGYEDYGTFNSSGTPYVPASRGDAGSWVARITVSSKGHYYSRYNVDPYSAYSGARFYYRPVGSSTWTLIPTANFASQNLCPLSSSDLSISKTVNTTTPIVGSNVIFTLTSHNGGPNDDTSVVVSDLLPAGYSYVSDDSSGAYVSATGIWTIGNLTNGANRSINIVAKVNASGNHTNSATISGGLPEVDLTNNSAAATTVPVPAASALNINKSSTIVPPDLFHLPSAKVLYDLNLSNPGVVLDNNSLVVSDVWPTNLLLDTSVLPPSSGFVNFVDGTPSSGLTFNPSTGVKLYDTSNNLLTPTGGLMANVARVEMSLGGIFTPSILTPYPNFKLQLRGQIK